jgi:hypothetical protein
VEWLRSTADRIHCGIRHNAALVRNYFRIVNHAESGWRVLPRAHYRGGTLVSGEGRMSASLYFILPGAEAITKIDWERGKVTLELSADQSRAVEAKMDGLDLQAAEAGDELGWEAARVAAVRRSLEPDRRLGRKLLRHFAAYKRAR